MTAFDRDLAERLDAIRQTGLERRLREVDSPPGVRLTLEGRNLLNFSSNDYLGLANHPALKAAAAQALDRYGAGSAASRLICGSLRPHHDLEAALAEFKGLPAAVAFSSGYAAALGTIPALLSGEDCVILDRLVHACIIDAARLSGARLRVFPHNDLNALEALLRRLDSSRSSRSGARPRTLIVTESVFSMDGDFAPLRELVALKDKYGAWLMVDEAHATGLFGAEGRGRAEELGVALEIEVHMGTLGKALGASGGYIAGSRPLVDFLVNRSRSFIFSTAPVPAAAGAAAAGIALVRSAEGAARREALFQRVAELPESVKTAGVPPSAIVPIILGDEAKAVNTSLALRERGVFVPAIRYPSVPRKTARLRLTLTADHRREDVLQLAQALSEATLA